MFLPSPSQQQTTLKGPLHLHTGMSIFHITQLCKVPVLWSLNHWLFYSYWELIESMMSQHSACIFQPIEFYIGFSFSVAALVMQNFCYLVCKNDRKKWIIFVFPYLLFNSRTCFLEWGNSLLATNSVNMFVNQPLLYFLFKFVFILSKSDA